MSEHLPPPSIDWVEARQVAYAKAMVADRYGIMFSYEQALRSEVCGIMSYALARDLEGLGYQSGMVISQLEDEAYRKYGARSVVQPHVVATAETDVGRVYIDGTYSQFFKPFGLRASMIEPPPVNINDRIDRNFITGQINAFEAEYNPFPDETALIYQADEIDDVAAWGADVVTNFWRNHAFNDPFQQANLYRDDRYDQESFEEEIKPFTNVPREELEAYFRAVWRTDQYRPFLLFDEERNQVFNLAYENFTLTEEHFQATGKWMSPQDIRINQART